MAVRDLRQIRWREFFDASALWSLANKGMTIVGTLLVMVCVVVFLSAEEQGYFYTFASLLALQVFFDLALPGVLTNVASHEWALARSGTTERLSALVAASGKWFFRVAVLFAIGVGAAGYLFLRGGASSSDLVYVGPWLWAVGLHAIGIGILPYTALLEGCNQVAEVQKNRFFQMFLSSIAVCLLLACDFGLWAVAAGVACKVVCNWMFVFVKKKSFFQALGSSGLSGDFSWKREVLPLQWRIALLALVNYFVFSLFTPVAFRYGGAEEAARVGMTLQIANALTSISLTCVFVKIPQFGSLIATKSFRQLDRLWFKTAIFAIAVNLLLLACALPFFRVVLGYGLIAARICDFGTVAVFLGATVFVTMSQCMSVYLRAHKQEPLVFMGVIMSVVLGLGVWWVGKTQGCAGMAWVQAGCWMIVVAWEAKIWFDCRRLWHKA